MRRTILTAVLVALLFIPFALANPISPGYINELFFAGGNWVLEIDTHVMAGESLDGWSISSRSGTAAIKPGISTSAGYVLITPDSLVTPLGIDAAGDSVTVKTTQYPMSLLFGSGANCAVKAPSPGTSICFNGSFFYLDQSPTLGVENDTTGAMATVRGIVKDADTQTPVTPQQIWDMSNEYKGWTTLGDSGKFSSRVYSHNTTLAAFLVGYQGGGVHLSLAPGQVVDTVIFIRKLDAVAEPAVPQVSALYQNYPNPFNPSTTIVFDLPAVGKVTLTVYDAIGKNVAELVRGIRTPGQYRVTWNGRDDNGVPMASGIYLACLELIGMGGGKSVQKAIKLLLIR